MRTHLFIVTALLIFSGSMFVVHAQTDYIPLAPIPNITDTGKTTTSLPTYLTGLYKTGIAAAGILAVLMLVWGGFQYMTTEAVSGKSESKGIIMNVVWGLATVLASYVLLYTINPRLVDIGLALTNLNSVTKTRIPTAQEAYGQRLDQLLKELNDLNKQPDVIAAKAAKANLLDLTAERRDLVDRINALDPNKSEEAGLISEYQEQLKALDEGAATLKTKTSAATLAAKSIEIKEFKVNYLEDENGSRITQLQESIKKSAAELRAAGKETEAKQIEENSAKAVDEVKRYFECYKGLIVAHAQGAITESERVAKCQQYSTRQIANYK